MSELPRRVIVFESQPYWEPELQRQFLDEDVHVATCRSVDDLDLRLHNEPFDVVILDFSADVARLLRWLSEKQDRGNSVPVVVVAAESQHTLKWHVRELGAAAFAHEYVGGQTLAAMCRKQWNNTGHVLP